MSNEIDFRLNSKIRIVLLVMATNVTMIDTDNRLIYFNHSGRDVNAECGKRKEWNNNKNVEITIHEKKITSKHVYDLREPESVFCPFDIFFSVRHTEARYCCL